jgi:hypothetical protein
VFLLVAGAVVAWDGSGGRLAHLPVFYRAAGLGVLGVWAWGLNVHGMARSGVSMAVLLQSDSRTAVRARAPAHPFAISVTSSQSGAAHLGRDTPARVRPGCVADCAVRWERVCARAGCGGCGAAGHGGARAAVHCGIGYCAVARRRPGGPPACRLPPVPTTGRETWRERVCVSSRGRHPTDPGKGRGRSGTARIASAPLWTVTFADILLADVFTSFAKAHGDAHGGGPSMGATQSLTRSWTWACSFAPRYWQTHRRPCACSWSAGVSSIARGCTPSAVPTRLRRSWPRA